MTQHRRTRRYGGLVAGAGGNFTPCTGNQCVGDAATDTPTLAYGQTARLGPFSCLSSPGSVTCTVDSGGGVAISRAAVFPV